MTLSKFPPDWLSRCPGLSDIDDPAWQQAALEAHVRRFTAGQPLYYEGDPCAFFVIIIEGRARIEHISNEGHEITLYHIDAGDTCRLNTSCVLGGQVHQAGAVAETSTLAAFIPSRLLHKAIAESDALRQYVFRSLDSGLNDLVSLVDEVAFGDMDRRLAKHLLAQASDGNVIATTHQALANELGTAREVVSRLLKHFESQGWIVRERGRIRIVDRAALQELKD